MFRGLTTITVDDKGRITVPAQYRRDLTTQANGALVITIDTEDPCLWLYPFPQWQTIEQQLSALPNLHPATRRIQRLLIGHATDVEMDSHGRILLPGLLREYAGLNKSVALVGQGKKFEIWDEQRWRTERDNWLDHDDGDDGGTPPELASIVL